MNGIPAAKFQCGRMVQGRMLSMKSFEALADQVSVREMRLKILYATRPMAG